MGHCSLAEKKSPEAEKIIFFEIICSVAHLPIKTKLFCFYQNFISSAIQRNHGGQKKRKFSAKNNATG